MKKAYSKPTINSESTMEQTSLACTINMTFSAGCYLGVRPFTETYLQCDINVVKNNNFIEVPFGCSGGQNLGISCIEAQNLS